MIKSIKIKTGLLSSLFHENGVDMKNHKIKFNKDINFIVGKNGCGKSLLLNTISEYCLVDEVGASKYSSLDYKRHCTFNSDNRFKQRYTEDLSTIDLDWSGMQVFHLTSKYFTNDHLNIGYEMGTGKRVEELPRFFKIWKQRLSTGQMNKLYQKAILDLDLKHCNDICNRTESYEQFDWKRFIDKVSNYDLPQKPILLLDEIDSHLDLYSQQKFINEYIPKLAEKFQVICISHSAYVLKSKNIIWLSDKITI